MGLLIKLLSLIFILLISIPCALAADVSGGEDHPLITRFPGSEITWYERQTFETYKIALAPVTGFKKIEDWLPVSGKLTRINYTLRGERGIEEVYGNYLNAITRAGFEVLVEGLSKTNSAGGKVGQRGFLGVSYEANLLPPEASRLLKGSSSSGGSGYFAAKLKRPSDTVYVVVGTSQFSKDEITVVVDVIEQKAMEDNLVKVDAEAMSKDIDLYGKVALYGIYFDHDKATIKSESKPALDEIAKLLNNRPKLNVYVVGHTDGVGVLDYNERLSKARAQAVVQTLIQNHGIAKDRLQPHGVGPLVPIATNREDGGRSKNRRVELVER